MTALHSNEYRRFVEVLAQTRRDAGVSQYELADRLKVDQSYISKVESARRRLDVIEFLQIVHALRVPYQVVLDQVARGSELSNRWPSSE